MSTPIDDSGPAFPVSNDANNNGQLGMTLRDWFAGQALAGLLSNSSPGSNRVLLGGKQLAMDMAEASYAYADAMIRERK